jgi:hypothetical protein
LPYRALDTPKSELQREVIGLNKSLALLIPILLVLSVLAGCSGKPYMPSKAEMVEPTMKVIVFYPGPDSLYTEEHEVPESMNVPRAALEELIRGTPQAKIESFFPKKAKILGVRVEDGVATVNFSREILDLRVDTQSEQMGIAAIVRTLTEFRDIKKIRIVVEGKEKGKVGKKRVEDWWGNGLIKNQPFEMK